MRFTVSTRAGRVIAVGPRSVMSAMPVRGVSFGLASIKMPPAACISCGKLAAGYTVADVPITIMQVAFELCRKHESKVPRGIGSPNITVSDFTGDPQSGHIGGKLFDRVIKTHWDAVTDGAKKSNLVPDRKEWRIAREVYIADTTEEARKHVMEGVLKRDYEKYWFNLLSTKENMKSDINLPDSDVDVEYLMDNLWIVGSPDDALEQIKELYDDVGGFGVLLAMGHEWEPKEHWINSMTLLADEVMPKLAHI